ncbi:ribosomal-processing cysteine protease Prp [Leptotrichia sp. HSP-334]|uniref:Ribosomal processing cysteine protease Prp n=1 Tax=Leptotrichia rugosa TaxID=3239302 RepID=A0AB39VDY0_9FUSO
MIKIKIKREKNRIVYFKISEHADYANHGEDIVCAAVSSVSQMTLNGILEILKLNGKVKYEIDESGKLICDLQNSNLSDEEFKKVDILTESMYSYLKDIVYEYKEFVKFE